MKWNFLKRKTKAFTTKGIVGGWTLETDAIYTGAKSIADGFAAAGFTLAANGGIHTPRFYLNQDGSMGMCTSLTGARIEINSTTNRIEAFAATNALGVRLGDAVSGAYPGVAAFNPADPTDKCELNYGGILAYNNGIESLRVSAGVLNLAGLTKLQADGTFIIHNIPNSSGGLASKQVYRDDAGYLRMTI